MNTHLKELVEVTFDEIIEHIKGLNFNGIKIQEGFIINIASAIIYLNVYRFSKKHNKDDETLRMIDLVTLLKLRSMRESRDYYIPINKNSDDIRYRNEYIDLITVIEKNIKFCNMKTHLMLEQESLYDHEIVVKFNKHILNTYEYINEQINIDPDPWFGHAV